MALHRRLAGFSLREEEVEGRTHLAVVQVGLCRAPLQRGLLVGQAGLRVVG